MIEFTHEDVEYRLARGVGSDQWLLVGLMPAGWRLLMSFSRKIEEKDIQAIAVEWLDGKSSKR